MSTPRTAHMGAVYRILQYLQGTRTTSVLFSFHRYIYVKGLHGR
ncbi:hypothetical protein LINPERPRIM_LOCUS20332 [Linum perenne]